MPTTVFVDYLDMAQAIGERLYLINAMESSPLPIARYVSLPQIRENWATTDGMDERVKVYRRWISLKGGTFADGDYAGRVIWAYQRAFPDARAEQVLWAGDLCLELLRWTKVNYPSAPAELVCDVMLTMLGAFDITEEDLYISPGVTTPTIPQDEREEEKKDNRTLIAIIAIAFLALMWR